MYLLLLEIGFHHTVKYSNQQWNHETRFILSNFLKTRDYILSNGCAYFTRLKLPENIGRARNNTYKRTVEEIGDITVYTGVCIEIV